MKASTDRRFHRLLFAAGIAALLGASSFAQPLTPTATATATPTPGGQTPDGCVSANDVYTSPTLNLEVVNLGVLTVHAAILPGGTFAYLSVDNCDGDNERILDVYIPWSGKAAQPPAGIIFSPNLCRGDAPVRVVLYMSLGTDATFKAINDVGGVVDSATAASGANRIVTLQSDLGIRMIDIEGAEICLVRVCWYCPQATPTPTPTSSAKPTDTATPTETLKPTDTATPTETFTPTPTHTFVPKPTDTFTPTPTHTSTPRETDTGTPTNTATKVPTDTPTERSTDTPTPTPTWTPTPTATKLPTDTHTDTPTPTATLRNTATFTATRTATPTRTFTPTPTATPTLNFRLKLHPYHPPVLLKGLEPFVIQDLGIFGIEVTQGIQYFDNTRGINQPDNSLPLVLGKSTAARIYLSYFNSLTLVDERDNVPVRLFLRANGGAWISADATSRALGTLDQSDVNNSANVYFSVASGLAAVTVDLYAIVDPDGTISESMETNNRYPAVGYVTVEFYRRGDLRILGRRLDYHPAGYAGTRQAGGWAVDGGAASWFNALLPLANNHVDYSVASGYQDWTSTLGGSSANQHSLISTLNGYWALMTLVNFLFGNLDENPDHVYGWAPAAGYGGGHADMPVYPHAGGLGVVGIGTDNPGTSTDNPGSGALIFGHELIHDYDIYHTDTADSCGSTDSNSNFPYSNSSIQEFGFNPLTGMVYNPANTHDVMSYCPSGGSKQGWISPFTWNQMFNNLSSKASLKANRSRLAPIGSGPSLLVNATVFNPTRFANVYLGMFGEMHKIDAGAGLKTVREWATGELGAVGPMHDENGPHPNEVYSIELRAGTILLASKEFSIHFESEYSDEPEVSEVNTFQVLPWDALTTSVALVHAGKTLDERFVTLAAPSVNVTRPDAPDAWPAGSTQQVVWTASDPDSASLTFSVSYRSRLDRAWELLANGLTQTSYEVAVDSLAGATEGYFRVVASDGINIGYDESDAPVTIPGHAPIPIITNPAEGSRFAPGGLVVFLGIATDMEDGMLPDEALHWSSDLEGDLGTGGTLTTTDLVPGTHTISLSVQDSEANSATATVKIVVNTMEVFMVDLNEDGFLNEADLFEVIRRWHHSVADGYPPSKADFNTDGVVDSEDLLRFQQYWQTGP